ncbi:MAG: EamA/RhaT family transporter [Nonlabens sp.]|jgi:drug/metabolite transporter (DMT)-like permease|uniref:EamA/RhaT family transporter n=1 Tax=Nonlabens sp. TaxID=1888209 RepID=UPI0035A6E8A8
MIWLILSITTSSLLYVIFKYFEVFKVHTLHAIILNYIVACVTGFIAHGSVPEVEQIISADWLFYALFLGALFIFMFNIMALTSQKNGLSVAAVAGKMSLVIPVMAGFWLYEESIGWIKIAGILLALSSVYLTSVKSRDRLKFNTSLLVLPIILFIGSGVIDTTLKYVEKTHVLPGEEPLFSAMCFATAFVLGILILIYEATQKRFLTIKSLIAGIVLGIPNYYSIYFIIKTLKNGMESSVVYPINHVGTVLFTSLLGILLFKEKLIPKNYIGIVVAVAAILMIAF